MSSISAEIKRKWKPRKKNAHKGDFGRVFVLAGAKGYAGAAYLTSFAAVRAGAGLVTLGVPEAIYPAVAKRATEVMVKSFKSTNTGSFAYSNLAELSKFIRTQDVLAIGPGLTQNSQTQKLVRHLLNRTNIPVVIDADGLNALKRCEGCLERAAPRAVLTPHPGEFKRLFGGKLDASLSLRKRRAEEIVKKLKTVLVLKGSQTLVAAPKKSIYVNRTGNPGMATGGTGDVLTGVIAALIGQHFDRFDAARFAVYLHGLAGDLAVRKYGEVSLAASDLLEFLPQAIKKTRRS